MSGPTPNNDWPPRIRFTPEGVAAIFLRQEQPEAGAEAVQRLAAIFAEYWRSGYSAAQDEGRESRRDVLNALRLVAAGLKNGGIRRKPVVSFSADDEQADMRSLEQIINDVIAKASL